MFTFDNSLSYPIIVPNKHTYQSRVFLYHVLENRDREYKYMLEFIA